jgi:soluble cytochrome b562
MADGRETQLPESATPRAREAHGPPSNRTRFEATPEFKTFRRGMKKLLMVPKAALDARVKAAKEASPRVGNPKAAGRKKKSG